MRRHDQRYPALSCNGFYVAAVLAVLGLAVAVRVSDADAIVTMRRVGAPPRGANPDSDNGPVSEGS
ncbi:hypothetical protein [Parafrankia sp. FMc2]|uniref:hypothetical protein n=1 Tax=Parafrankia sp. FMc2 TaxID=3233196 RepID=UPI0034D3E626